MKQILLYASVLLMYVASLGTVNAQSTAQPVRYGIKLDADKLTYRVYMTSAVSLTGIDARIATAQVTIRVPHALGTNRFTFTNVQGRIVGPDQMIWTSGSGRVDAPLSTSSVGNPAVVLPYDYISFGFSSSTSPVSFDIPANTEMELFSFQRNSPCTGIVSLFENATDPFRIPNSAGTNPGNQMTIRAYGPVNTYLSNYLTAVDCLPASLSANLSTTVQMTNGSPSLGGTTTALIVVTNSGPDAATGVVSRVTLPTNYPVTSSSASIGSFSATTGQWAVGNLSVGQSATLSVTLSTSVGGIGSVINEIIASGQPDPNSTPNNQVDTEDDIASSCFSVPIELCAGQSFTASIPGTFTSIQWRLNGQIIQGASSNTLNITQAGTYTVETNVACPASGCCPIIVIDGACCPVNVCVPVTVTQIKRG